jgi:hypothetical protein
MKTINPKILRDKNNLKIIPDLPGYYKWWSPDHVVRQLLGDFYDDLMPRLICGENELSGYYYIYVGIASKSLRQRLNWHINQKNDLSAVRSGFLSTLRTSISSLVSNDQSDTDGTNKIIDEMMVQFEPSESFREIELSEMSAHVLPLNSHSQPQEILKNGFTKHLKCARKKWQTSGV